MFWGSLAGRCAVGRRPMPLGGVLPSETLRCFREGHAEGGDLEMLPSINGRVEAPRICSGPDFTQQSDESIT